MQHERIATLLATGLSDSQVATIIGVSPGRISQIKKEEEFQLLLSAKQEEIKEKDIEEVSLSAKYNAAEHLLIAQISEMAPVSELRDITAALRVVAERQEKMKSRINPIINQAPVYNNIVQLQLPAHAVPELILTREKEVLAIGNRNLTPLSSEGVLGLFRELDRNTNGNTIGGRDNEPERILGKAEGSSQEALPTSSSSSLGVAEGARKFLSSFVKRQDPLTSLEGC